MANLICVVYWLYDERCICPWRHGYIGISTVWLTHRRGQHRRGHGTIKGARLVPAIFNEQILFVGTVSECQALELELRPHPRIGWNLYRGGHKGSLGYRHTLETRENMAEAARKSGHSKRPKTPEWRAAISAATIRRYARPGELAKTIASVKRAFAHGDFRRKPSRRSILVKHGQLDFDL